MRNLILAGLAALLLPQTVLASAGAIDLTQHWVGFVALTLFVIAYFLVVIEERTHLRKSIPVIIAAGGIWALIALVYAGQGDNESVQGYLRHGLLEYAELMLFLLVAMTYINIMQERNVFEALRGWLISRGFSLRAIYWITGTIAFFMSPLADNMTTALVLASVALAVGRDNPRFVVVACVSIVVAANAGGVFSPFGDITTLMVWQKGKLDATEFLVLFVPSLVNWLVPAAIMSFVVPKSTPPAAESSVHIKRGGVVVIFMFIGTVAMTVSLHSFLHLPPAFGMVTGLGLVKLFGWWIEKQEAHAQQADHLQDAPLNTFNELARSEWDTLLFFYGVIMCVGGLGTIGYLAVGSEWMYNGLGETNANILVGVVSAIVDNIPVMYAVLTMNPPMPDGQWLLVTMTAGVGGSLLSIGSAAGVAVMGQARGVYTFGAHFKWSWAIALGYAASIAVHFWINGEYFSMTHPG